MKRAPAAVAVALLILYLGQALLSMRDKVATYDETSHLPSGYTHLAWGDYRFNPEHPPLVKMLAAVPLLASGAKAPSTPTSGKAWQLGLTERNAQWAFGWEFLYATPGNDADRLLFRGRLIVLALALLLVAWLGWSSLSIHPHYLAYFNELAGGPRNSVRWLADSNLDWGQDLKLLKQWLDRKGINQVYLSYFGMADPDYYGIKYVNLPGGTSYSQRAGPPQLPGYVAISATNLTGVYFPPRLREAYTRLLGNATLVDTVGYSIYVYSVR